MTQGKRTVELADQFRLKFVTSAALSPDSKRIAYTVTHVDAEKEEEYGAIWIVNADGSGAARQLTTGSAKDGAPAWSPDGKQIAFMSTRGEKPQIYVISVDGGEAQAITSLKQGVGGGPVWSPDGKQIVFSAVPIEEARDPKKAYRVTRHVYRFDALEYLDDVVQSLYLVDACGGEARRLTPDSFHNGNPQWSPDGTEILYSASMPSDNHRAFYPRLHILNVASGAIREIVAGWGEIGIAGWTPDGKSVAFTGTPSGKLIGSKNDVWIIGKNGGTPECRTAGLKVGVEGGLEADMPFSSHSTKLRVQGGFAYPHVQDGGTIQIYQVALTGAESFKPIVAGERTCMLQSVNSQHLVYLASDINQPTDVYISNLDGSGEKRLTNINAELLSQLKLPTVKHLEFKGSDGAAVEGWLMIPPEGQAPYPMIQWIHGGPHAGQGHVFSFDAQMFCGAGYAVLMVNHRASTGYGDEFSTAIKGDWGNLDYHDLMAGVDYVIAQGWVDPNRMGVTGISGGGNLSTWIVGQTDRFKAAAPENPVTNWVSFYGVSDIGVWFAYEQMGGHPHEIPEVYARCSPISYAHRCTTPTLLIQSEHDWRCPAEQSEQFYAVLKANGCTVEMLRLPDTSHGGMSYGPPTLRKSQNEALLSWMNQYVLGKTE